MRLLFLFLSHHVTIRQQEQALHQALERQWQSKWHVTLSTSLSLQRYGVFFQLEAVELANATKHPQWAPILCLQHTPPCPFQLRTWQVFNWCIEGSISRRCQDRSGIQHIDSSIIISKRQRLWTVGPHEQGAKAFPLTNTVVYKDGNILLLRQWMLSHIVMGKRYIKVRMKAWYG